MFINPSRSHSGSVIPNKAEYQRHIELSDLDSDDSSEDDYLTIKRCLSTASQNKGSLSSSFISQYSDQSSFLVNGMRKNLASSVGADQ